MFPRDEDGDEQHDLWLLQLESGEAEQLTAAPGAQEIPIEFSPDDEWLSFVSTRDSQMNLYTMQRDGSGVTPLTRFDSPVQFGGQWSPDGRQLIAGANKRIPAIVMPHGGPTWQYFHAFDPYVQFLVNEGYAVLSPNIRGSTGYGAEFRDMARHDWGGADLQDILAGRQYLAGRSFVDPDRIAIFGVSYGGYMTYIALTKAPEAWKAGVAWVGMTGLAALYEESMPHFKHYLEEQMGDPKAHADLWADRSAANFAERMQAKLLIVHGVNDPRCPISQARLFRDRLLAAGKQEGRDFEYVELSEEGHGSADQEQRLRAFQLLADFLQRTL